MEDELSTLHKTKTWTLVPLDGVQNVLSCNWVFKLKQDEYGNINCHKARLEANGMK